MTYWRTLEEFVAFGYALVLTSGFLVAACPAFGGSAYSVSFLALVGVGVSVAYLGFVFGVVLFYDDSMKNIENDISGIKNRVDLLRTELNGPCSCFGLQDDLSLFNSPMHVLTTNTLSQITYGRRATVLVVSLSAVFLVLTMAFMLYKDPKMGHRASLYGHVVLSVTMIAFVVNMAMLDLVEHGTNDLEQSSAYTSKFLRGVYACTAYKHDINTVQEAAGCIGPDFANDTSCIYSASDLFSRLQYPVGNPLFNGAAIWGNLSLYLQTNGVNAWASCINGCIGTDNSTIMPIETVLCNLQSSVVSLIGKNEADYINATLLMVYGVVLVTCVYLWLVLVYSFHLRVNHL